jgi:hypothetical protein
MRSYFLACVETESWFPRVTKSTYAICSTLGVTAPVNRSSAVRSLQPTQAVQSGHVSTKHYAQVSHPSQLLELSSVSPFLDCHIYAYRICWYSKLALIMQLEEILDCPEKKTTDVLSRTSLVLIVSAYHASR